MGTDNGPGKGPAILPIEASPSSERTGLLGDDTLYKIGMFRLAGRTSEECKDLKFAPEKDGAVPHTKWYMTSFLIAGEVMGAGLLALPAAAAKLGWTMTILAMFACALASSYSGSAIARVKNEFYTYADGYADLAHATGGPAFGLFARLFIVFNWSMLCPYYLISIGSAIKNTFQGVSVCNWVWSLISVALVWLPSQFTTLKYVSYLAIPSAAAIVLAALMIIAQLLLESDGFGKHTSAGTPPTAPGKSDFAAFLTTYSAFSSIVFAFQGQDMFCEMIHDMEDQSQAIQAVTTSYILMGSNYLFMTTMAYGAKGSTVADFLPDALPPGPTKSVVNLLVAFHVIVAYVITSNVACKVFYSVLFKSTPLSHASTKPWSESWTIRARWLLLTSFLSIFAFIIANLIPAFGAFQGLLGAFCAAPIVFGFPALFLYLGHRHHDRPMPKRDVAICSLFCFVLMPSMMALGTFGAVYDMMDALKTAGMPFACGPTEPASILSDLIRK